MNNLWHLLPAPTTSNFTTQHDTTLTPVETAMNNNNLNVLTKNEPLTGAEPSPVASEMHFTAHKQQEYTITTNSYQQSNVEQTQINNLANGLKSLSVNEIPQATAYNSQESMPFYPNTTTLNPNVVDVNSDQQSQQNNSNNYSHNIQDTYNQSNQSNQTIFNPVEYQVPNYQPQPDNYDNYNNTYQHQSRKSSVSSIGNTNNTSQGYNADTNYQNQSYTLSNNTNNNVSLYQPNTVRGESVSSNYSGPTQKAETNRSRLSSVSTNGGQNDVPTFYNPYSKATAVGSQQQLFDPSNSGQSASTNIQRSTTFPVTDANHYVKQEMTEERMTASMSANNTNTMNNNNNNNDEDLSDDDLGVGNPKPKTQAEKEKDAKKQEEQQVRTVDFS